MTNPLFESRTACRLCRTALRVVVPLNPLPVASPNVGVTNKVAEMASADLCQCPACGFLQLPTVVNPEFQYRNFKYVTGISVGLREHFKQLIDGLVERGEINARSFVFDIGSNDGSLLALAKAYDAKVLGIDPAETIAKNATAAGIPTIADFFGAARAKAIAAEHGQADVVISNNTVANLDDLDDFFGGIDAMLKAKGLLVIETQYALDVLRKFLLDVIYHEHVSYFAVSPFKAYLAARGMELVDAEPIAPKGGSIRFFVQRKGGGRPVSARVEALMKEEKDAGMFEPAAYAAFSKRVEQVGAEIRTKLEQSREKTGRALAFGSSVGCAALIQYFGLAPLLDAVFDDTPLSNVIRAGKTDIPVLTGRQLDNEAATDILVLSWRYAENIAAKQGDYVGRGGRFYRSLPELSFVDGG